MIGLDRTSSSALLTLAPAAQFRDVGSVRTGALGGGEPIALDPSERAQPRTSGFLRTLDALRDSQRTFMAATGRIETDPNASDEENARATAERFVAGALVLPMLKEMRESSSSAPPPFGPGEGEKKFLALSDASLADSIVSAKSFPLVDRLTDTLLRRGRSDNPWTRFSTPLDQNPASVEPFDVIA